MIRRFALSLSLIAVLFLGVQGALAAATATPTPTVTGTPSTSFCVLRGSDGKLGGPLYAVFNPTTIFPLLPGALLGQDSSIACSPPYWSIDVFKILIYKVLGLLNYLILVFALIFTVYAGVLYILGFANEGNVKKAKTVLIGTYTGLILAFSARLILGATIGLVADSTTPGTVINQNDQTILNGQ